MSREYNMLTQRLLEEGYTADKYPEYVRIASGRYGKDPLQNLHGGFEYTSEYLGNIVFKTGCGLLVKGSNFSSGGMGYMGIDWIPENDNPVIACPFHKDDCDKKNPILRGAHGGGISKLLQCDCHCTQEPYTYDKSIDKARDDI